MSKRLSVNVWNAKGEVAISQLVDIIATLPSRTDGMTLVTAKDELDGIILYVNSDEVSAMTISQVDEPEA